MTAFAEFAATPLRLRLWIGSAAVLAIVLPVLLSSWPHPPIQAPDLWAALAPKDPRRPGLLCRRVGGADAGWAATTP